jgi:hypothetical protein
LSADLRPGVAAVDGADAWGAGVAFFTAAFFAAGLAAAFFATGLAAALGAAFFAAGLAAAFFATGLAAALGAAFFTAGLAAAFGATFLAAGFAAAVGFFALVAMSTSISDFKDNYKLEHCKKNDPRKPDHSMDASSVR